MIGIIPFSHWYDEFSILYPFKNETEGHAAYKIIELWYMKLTKIYIYLKV